jgi:hypothetical protein
MGYHYIIRHTAGRASALRGGEFAETNHLYCSRQIREGNLKEDNAAARHNYVSGRREARWRTERHSVLRCLAHNFEALIFVGLYSGIASAVPSVLMSPHVVQTVVSHYVML